MPEAKATVILDSISPDGIRLTTFQLQYWRGIHSELMTHRVFSRNAGSSRARPSGKIIEQVRNDPWGPIHWGANQAGMQAHEELKASERVQAERTWKEAAVYAADSAQLMVEANAHKQIVNRLLEPFTYIDVVLTSTDFNNWFALRDHQDAQPEIRDLAIRMKHVMEASTPEKLDYGQWHLPYIQPEDYKEAYWQCKKNRITRDEPGTAEINAVLCKISVARCARVSYKAFDGTISPIEKDLELFDKLLVSQPLHASPAEHQATPDEWYGPNVGWAHPELHGNFRGWKQYRKMIKGEFIAG